jgi:hypothetical protein
MDNASAGKVTCVTCGKEYTVCKKCEQAAKTFQSWRMSACCPECWQISQIINQWFFKVISAADALLMLKAVETADIEMTGTIQQSIKKIKAEAETPAPARSSPRSSQKKTSIAK